METKNSKVLIGITSKNRKDILPVAIRSALEQELLNKEVAVYDDNSTDGTDLLAEEFTGVSWHLAKQNNGYVYARNMFLQTTDADYYCSLDDDSWFLSKDKLPEAIKYMDESPHVAALAFKILSNNSDKEIRKGDKIVPTNNFIGCGHLLRVSAANRAGNYAVNPGYYGGEEKDLCMALINNGYTIMRFPDVEVWHDKTEVSRDLMKQHRSVVCNDLVFMWRRTPLLYLLPAILKKAYVHLVFPVKYKNKKLYKPMFNGMADFLKALTKGKIKRQAVTVKAFRTYLKFNETV